MTPNQITLVRETWSKVAPIADTAAQMFYQKLFEIDPGAKRLFAKTDMKRQRGMLLDALGLVVQNAEQPERLTPVLEELARRHVRYGVEDHHYTSVGIALIATLEQGLGSAFTDEARAAWISVYKQISGAMRSAAGDVIPSPTPRSGFAAAAVAGCMALGLAGGLTAISAPVATPQAHAFGWSDVTGAAKQFGETAVSGVKQAGESIGRAGKYVGKGVAENAKDFGAATKRDAKKIGGFAKGVGKGAVDNAKDFGAATARDAKKIGGFVKDTASTVYDHNLVRTVVAPTMVLPGSWSGAACGDIKRYGKYGCEFKPGGIAPTKNLKPTPPATGPGSWGGPPNAPGGFNGSGRGIPDTSRIAQKGPTAQSFSSKIESLATKRGNQIVPKPVLKPIQPTKGTSVFGEKIRNIKRLREPMMKEMQRRRGPSNVLSKSQTLISKRKSDAPVQGIAKENLKPGHGRTVKNTVVRDKSVWGRPIGVRKPDSKLKSKVNRIARKPRPVGTKNPVLSDPRVKNSVRRGTGLSKGKIFRSRIERNAFKKKRESGSSFRNKVRNRVQSPSVQKRDKSSSFRNKVRNRAQSRSVQKPSRRGQIKQNKSRSGGRRNKS